MKNIKAIIFDLDGTLADTLPLCIKSFQLAFKEITGIKHPESTITRFFGQTEEGITKSIAPDRWEDCFNAYIRIYKNNHHLCPAIFEGTKEILDFLKENHYKIAMVTGKGKPSADITLDYFGIKNYFEYVETGSAEGIIKDKCIAKILNYWQIPADQAAYIGDQPSDITCSKKAGVLPIAVAWASTANAEKLKAENPYKIFSKIEYFKSWLEQITENKKLQII
jgi:phosphoglycolate phosphatase/pyrophosphatase PpaX